MVSILTRRFTRLGLASLAIGLALAFAMVGTVGADPPQCKTLAGVTPMSGSFQPGVPIPILNSPLLQATLFGSTGTYQAHIVWQPIDALPPAISDGCKENSWFAAEGFTGSLVATGPAIEELLNLPPGAQVPILVATQPIDVMLQVHFGTESNKPILTFRSDTPVSSVFALEPVRFIQIVGGEVTVIK